MTMKIRIPDDYDSFACLGGICPDNCCIGDELVIDDETWRFYQTIQGETADRLRSVLKEAETQDDDDGPVHCLSVEGRCPFLNDSNLCSLYLAYGARAQSRICAGYPRCEEPLAGAVEKSLILSCPEAARRLIIRRTPQTFLTEETDGPGIEETRGIRADELAAVEERDELITLIQDRTQPLSERLKDALRFCRERSGSFCFAGEYLIGTLLSADTGRDTLEADEVLFGRRLELLRVLPWHAGSWPKAMAALEDTKAHAGLYADRLGAFRRCAAEGRTAARHSGRLDSSEPFYPDETVFEQLIVYYLRRYYAWYLDDDDRESKLLTALFSCLVIRDLTMENAVPNRSVPVLYDIIRAVTTWTKTLEYDEENLFTLFDSMSLIA